MNNGWRNCCEDPKNIVIGAEGKSLRIIDGNIVCWDEKTQAWEEHGSLLANEQFEVTLRYKIKAVLNT